MDGRRKYDEIREEILAICLHGFLSFRICGNSHDSLDRGKRGVRVCCAGASHLHCARDLNDILPLTAPLFYAMCMIFTDKVEDFIFMWPTFIPLGIALAIFVVRNRARIRLGKMFVPQLLVSAALLLGGAGLKNGDAKIIKVAGARWPTPSAASCARC